MKRRIIPIVAMIIVAVFAMAATVYFTIFDDKVNEVYSIVAADNVELTPGAVYTFQPELVDSDNKTVDSTKTRYRYTVEDDYSSDITITSSGSFTVPSDFGEEDTFVVTIEEVNYGATAECKFTITTSLRAVGYITEEGESDEVSDQGYIVGDAIKYNIATIPESVDLSKYTTITVYNSEGEPMDDVFDFTIDGNDLYVEANGLGSGYIKVNIVNEDRNVNSVSTINFSVSLADSNVTQAILDSCGSSLITNETLQGITQIVLDESVTSIDMSGVELLSSLNTIVLESNSVVSRKNIPEGLDLIYRVHGQDVYCEYLESSSWDDAIDTVYPYIDDYTEKVIVYNNYYNIETQGTSLLVNMDGLFSIEEAKEIYNYVSDETPSIKIVVIDENITLEEYSLAGFEFDGWQDKNGNNKTSEDLSSVYVGIKLYASWTAVEYEIELEDYISGSTVNVATYGNILANVNEPKKNGWAYRNFHREFG